MNEMLTELDGVISSENSTELETDLALCVKHCIATINRLEDKLIDQVLAEE